MERSLRYWKMVEEKVDLVSYVLMEMETSESCYFSGEGKRVRLAC